MMENRVEKYKLNAKKAFEFAGGFREVIPGRDRTRRIYGKKAGRPEYTKKIELNSEEQLVLLLDLEYAYRYSVKLMGKRLAEEVEEKFLSQAETVLDVKYAIEYCNRFEIALPSCLHNRILMHSAVPVDKKGMAWRERYQIERSERRQKKYLVKFQEQRKSFKIILEGIIKENNLHESNTIKDLLDSI